MVQNKFMNTEQNKVNNQEQTENLIERLGVTDEIQSTDIVKKINNNTYVPIGVIIIVVAVGIYIGTLATTVAAMKEKDSPSRTEFSQICSQLSNIEKKVDTVNGNLLDLAKRDKN